MKLKKDIISISKLKSHAADMLKQVNTTGRPVIVTQNGQAKAVLQDPESYERLRNALGLLKLIAQAEEDIRSDRTIKQDDVFSQLYEKLNPDHLKR